MAVGWVARRSGGPEVLELEEFAVPVPGAGEVTIDIRAAGMNPADLMRLAGNLPRSSDGSIRPGLEVAGVLSAIGPGTTIASGGGVVGDEVIAFRIEGGYASQVTVNAADVFAKPAGLGFPEAANLLLAGSTAAHMLDCVPASAGETVLIHGASGAVGSTAVQQARNLGLRVIGTASASNLDRVRAFGALAVQYGDGLLERVRALAPEGVSAALDTVGTDEAIDVSLALVPVARLVTAAAYARAERDGIRAVNGRSPEGIVFRDAVRARLIADAAAGRLVVPVAATFPLVDVAEAMRLLGTGHPGGNLALVP